MMSERETIRVPAPEAPEALAASDAQLRTYRLSKLRHHESEAARLRQLLKITATSYSDPNAIDQ